VLKNRKPFRAIWELKIIHKRRRAMRLFLILAVQFCLVVWSFGSAAAYNLPDSGQTLCYDSSGSVIACDTTGYTGQDGAMILTT
jgi:hypothetical protein